MNEIHLFSGYLVLAANGLAGGFGALAWALRRPALVQGACSVLRGQAMRSGGAIPYEGFAELEAGIDLLASDRALGDAMGEAGRRYVEERYGWDVLLDRYEAVLEATAAARR